MASEKSNISNIDLAENSEEEKLNHSETDNTISDERREEITKDIEKLEDEINTLKQALLRKETQLSSLRTELGITRWSRIQNSQAVNKSKLAISGAGQKTTQVFRSLGAATASKWSEIKESEKMHTVSEKFWATTGVVKAKMYGTSEPTSEIQQETPIVQPAQESTPSQ